MDNNYWHLHDNNKNFSLSFYKDTVIFKGGNVASFDMSSLTK